MRVLLLTVGSQGDVQPFVALASRLRPDGHEAVLAAPALYSGLAAARDVPTVSNCRRAQTSVMVLVSRGSAIRCGVISVPEITRR